ncbi:leucine-rich repeat extensin-like protein 3 [Iris pallida]|uniref:Leucine-rich repeat extensin-like protein 3 n=1 Tax=Iris pallida TaxID=29817 RepID=A0AAX6FBY9_IRIPA|nr:leucine-rich repeat extensin-like protein 3 [Iris pallida]
MAGRRTEEACPWARPGCDAEIAAWWRCSTRGTTARGRRRERRLGGGSFDLWAPGSARPGDREERVQLGKAGGQIWVPCQRRRFVSGWRTRRSHRLRSRGQETLASSAKEEGRRWHDARGGRGLKRLGLGFFFYCFLSLSCRVLCRIFRMCPMLDSKTTFCGCND